jgi:hypothetical protein
MVILGNWDSKYGTNKSNASDAKPLPCWFLKIRNPKSKVIFEKSM